MSTIASIVFCLCAAIPVMGMEKELQHIKKEKRSLLITPEENKKFVSFMEDRLVFCRQVVSVKYLPQDNPIYTIQQMLFVDYLKDCDNDVLQLIKSQELEERINHYKKNADSSRVVKFCLCQIKSKDGDVKEARNCAAKNRQIIAEIELSHLQQKYSYCYMGDDSITGKINYMKRNAEYPTDEKAIKDFIALLIYQVIFAYQTH